MRKDKYTMKAVLQNARAMRTASLSGQNKPKINTSTSPNNNTNNRSPTNNSNRSLSPISSSMPYMNSQSFMPQQPLALQHHQQLPVVLDQFSQQSQSQYNPYIHAQAHRNGSLVNPNLNNFNNINKANSNNVNKYNTNLSCVMSQPSFSLSNYPITTHTQAINHNSNSYGHDKQPFNGAGYGYAAQESQPIFNNYNQHQSQNYYQHQSQNYYQPDQLN